MNTADVNVLLAASRSDHPHHAAARTWIEHALSEAAQAKNFVVFSSVAMGFLRIATHPKVFVSPTPIQKAWDFLDALRQTPGVNLQEGDTPWGDLRALSSARELAGNDLPDAWLASKVRHHHLRLATFDKGFKKLLRPSMLTLLT